VTSSASLLDALRRRRPEWAAWLDVLEEVEREIRSSRWDATVPGDAPERESSTPLLAGAYVPFDAAIARQFMDRLVGRASRVGTAAMATVERALGAGADLETIFIASVCQKPEELETIASSAGANVAAVQAVAALLCVPFLHACNQRWSSSNRVWTEGYCAVCGSWPAFAEVRGIDRSRYLRCGRCGGEWHARILHCAYCRTTNHDDLVTLTPRSATAAGVVEACTGCGGYVKAFTRLQGCAPAAVMLEDLGSIDLDVAAIEHGYARRAAPGYALDLTLGAISGAGCGIVASKA
jgi:FdhE protein